MAASVAPAKEASTPRRRALFIGIIVLVLAAIAELGAFLAGSFLQRKYMMYAEPAAQRSARISSYADYLRLRDPRLGWPFPVEFGGDFYDASGARYSAAFRDPALHANGVAVFGDSYAAGSEVDDERSWGNQLALLLGSRVGIFGVPGYGTDQAFLRFLSMDRDPSRVVILTHLSEDITRNLTRNWDLFTGMGYYGLKPRFVLDAGGALREVPLPRLTESEYLRSVGSAAPFMALEHENFQPGGPAGVTRLEFPYSLSVLRNLFGYQVRALFARRPGYAEFYEKGHPLGGLEITAKILEAFQAQARERGQRPLVLLLATRHDLAYARKTGTWTYAPLVEELRRAGVDHLDFGPPLLAHIGARDVRAFFKPLGHYNEEVSRLLAEAVHRALVERGAVTASAGAQTAAPGARP